MPLQIDGWKMKYPFKVVAFRGKHVHFQGGNSSIKTKIETPPPTLTGIHIFPLQLAPTMIWHLCDCFLPTKIDDNNNNNNNNTNRECSPHKNSSHYRNECSQGIPYTNDDDIFATSPRHLGIGESTFRQILGWVKEILGPWHAKFQKEFAVFFLVWGKYELWSQILIIVATQRNWEPFKTSCTWRCYKPSGGDFSSTANHRYVVMGRLFAAP